MRHTASPNTMRKPLGKRMREYGIVYAMIVPVIAFYLVFAYFPMYGIVISFKEYYASRGILGSEWLDPVWKNFSWLFEQEYFVRALRNTIVISLLKLVTCFPIPIILALFLSEIPFRRLRRGIQTMMYLPYFFSWAVIASIVYSLLATNNGMVNNIITLLGGERVNFLTEERYFYVLLIFAEIWKNAGWGSVIYVAAITNVNADLYEAAKIDGCSRLRMMRSITVPSILPIIVVLFIMQVGGIMNAGFDPVFNLYNASVYNVADILDTYIYRLGIGSGEYERAAALGLFKAVVNIVLLLGCNTLVKKLTGQGMYE